MVVLDFIVEEDVVEALYVDPKGVWWIIWDVLGDLQEVNEQLNAKIKGWG